MRISATAATVLTAYLKYNRWDIAQMKIILGSCDRLIDKVNATSGGKSGSV